MNAVEALALAQGGAGVAVLAVSAARVTFCLRRLNEAMDRDHERERSWIEAEYHARTEKRERKEQRQERKQWAEESAARKSSTEAMLLRTQEQWPKRFAAEERQRGEARDRAEAEAAKARFVDAQLGPMTVLTKKHCSCYPGGTGPGQYDGPQPWCDEHGSPLAAYNLGLKQGEERALAKFKMGE
jgi:hypothetical protein